MAKQICLFKKPTLSYGGTLLNSREGRQHGRPIDTKNSMHLVLKSSKAKNEYSFRRPIHAQKIKTIIKTFSNKYGILVHSYANVGNHLHLHLKISNRNTYAPFIRAVTASIAMWVSGKNRWNKNSLEGKFWDFRPFTRVVVGYQAFLNLSDYVKINQLEGLGNTRDQARRILEWDANRGHRKRSPQPIPCRIPKRVRTTKMAT